METSLGKLGWTPRTFWSASLIELTRAVDGFREFHSGNEENEPTTPMLSDEFEALKRKLGSD